MGNVHEGGQRVDPWDVGLASVCFTAAGVVLLSLFLLMRILSPWQAVANVFILGYLFETRNLDILSDNLRLNLRTRLSGVSAVLAIAAYNNINRVLGLLLFLYTPAIFVYLLFVLFRKRSRRPKIKDVFSSLVSPAGKDPAVVLFSGGTDSTCVAIDALAEHDTVSLLTFDRLGFYNAKFSSVRAARLKEKYGGKTITHEIINIDKFYKRVVYGRYVSFLMSDGLSLLLNCGLCKLAMHWCTILYCLNRRITIVYDGSNMEMVDPSQNESVTGEMKLMYERFGLELRYPVYYRTRQEREEKVYNSGVSDRKAVKWTKETYDIQPFCSQEELFMLYFRYRTFGFRQQDAAALCGRYERKMLDFHRRKREFIISEISRYISGEMPNYSTGNYYV